jgi:hypothetical protein
LSLPREPIFYSALDYNVESCYFILFSLPKEPVSNSTLGYKDSVNPTGYGSWNCCSTWCRGYMYQFLDEQDMWSSVEKNPKEMTVLEKHNTKVILWEYKKIVKIMFFSIGAVTTLLAI